MQLYFNKSNEAGAIAKANDINNNSIQSGALLFAAYALINRDKDNQPQYKVSLSVAQYQEQFNNADNETKNLFFYATSLAIGSAVAAGVIDLFFSSSVLELWTAEVQNNSDLLAVKTACNL